MAAMQENEVENNDVDEPREGEEAVEGEVLSQEDPAAQQDEQGDELQQKIEMLEKQARENLDTALRAQAELDNVRKRSSRDVENAHKYALEKFAADVLPVLDSMELGVSSVGESADNPTLREGMELTLKLFRDVLEKYGIEPVLTDGEKFDPEKHEAVSMQDQEGSESGDIISVFQKGYTLNGRLIRPAMVVVAS